MKVSFDFDGVLTRDDVQEFVGELIKKGVDVWVVTSRSSTEEAKKKAWWWVEKQNEYLFEVTDKCKIPRNKIVFTELVDKVVYLTDRRFLFHLDDNEHEISMIIESKINCVPINIEDEEWKDKCLEVLNKKP